MKIVVAPDKFKGSLSSFEACAAMAQGILQAMPGANILSFPMADGGDGFAAVMKHYLHTETIGGMAEDPLGRSISATYEWQPKSQTAIIELATASGLLLLSEAERNPLYTTTFGSGLQMMNAIEKGAKHIILGLGGSATNDAGTGILAALGFIFLDEEGNKLKPCGSNLFQIQKIVPPKSIPSVVITLACDVTNTLYGPQGAAHVFAGQKGASEDEIKLLDQGLKHFAAIIEKQTGLQVYNVAGAGAGGGVAAGLLPWFDVRISSGAQMVCEASGIIEALMGADVVITGEGKLDAQSSGGKVVQVVARLAASKKIPLAAICGRIEGEPAEWNNKGFFYTASLFKEGMDENYCMQHAAALISKETVLLLRNFVQRESY